MDISHSIRRALLEAQDTLNRFIQNPENIATIAETAQLMHDVFERRGRIFTCGNGGSLCDAIHFAEECTGRFRADRKPLPAIALSDAGHITCTANDFGFDEIFARPIEAPRAPRRFARGDFHQWEFCEHRPCGGSSKIARDAGIRITRQRWRRVEAPLRYLSHRPWRHGRPDSRNSY